jgi:broad specificity phosphatase PhoE
VGNSENRLQGQEDYDLTERGLEQASLTGKRLADEAVAAVYTSPLLRAYATARAIADAIGSEPRLVADVAEYHFGELSGATYAELRQRFAADPATANLRAADRVYPGEEGRDNFFHRVTESLWQIIDGHPGQSVAVVSHGGPIALFCQTVLGLPYQRPMPFSIDNCSLTLIEVADDAGAPRGERAVLAGLNDTSHLARLLAR